MTGALQVISAHDGVAAVDRAFAVLAALASEAEPCTLAQLSRTTTFYKSTILRLLASLEAAGYATRFRDGRYGLGPSAFRIGVAYERQNPLRFHVMPVLNDLVGHGTESASFHIVYGSNTRLCLFRVNSRHSTLDRVEAGDILPLDRGAAGRILMAFDPDAGKKHDLLRRAGYALSHGERDPDCAGLAAPVFGPSGQLAGALSLSGPDERFNDEAVAGMLKLLLPAAAELTRALGGKPLKQERAG